MWGKFTEPNKINTKAINAKDDELKRNQFITDYVPFILKTVSDQLKRYVETENSEEYSVGLIGFNEAIDKYEPSKGSFLSFAKLVIQSRIKDLLNKNKSLENVVYIENYDENIICNEDIELKMEIQDLENELSKFNISLDDLVINGPKHKDTREQCVLIGSTISKDKEIMDKIYEKFKIPITRIVVKYNQSKKTITRNKNFILTTSVIFYKNYEILLGWIKKPIVNNRVNDENEQNRRGGYDG